MINQRRVRGARQQAVVRNYATTGRRLGSSLSLCERLPGPATCFCPSSYPIIGPIYTWTDIHIQGGFLTAPPPLKVLSTKKLILARLGVSRTIYGNVDSPNLGFTYFNFLGGYQ